MINFINRILILVSGERIGFMWSRIGGIIFCLFLPLIAEVIFRYVDNVKLEKYTYFYKGYLTFHKYAPYLILLSTWITIRLVWSWVDSQFSSWYGQDFTPLLYKLEGNFVPELQLKMQNSFLDTYFYIIYVPAFTIIIYIFIFIYMYLDKERIIKMIISSQVIMYLFALPFFIFFPAQAIWTTSTKYPEYGYSDTIYNKLKEIDPTMHATIQNMNCINDAFPSLHVALPCTVLFVLLLTKQKKFSIISIPIVISIAISTMYMGIHWFVDVIGGVIFAGIAVYIAYNLDYELEFPMKIKYIKWKGKKLKFLHK